MNATMTEKSAAIVKLFRTFNSIEFHVLMLSFIHRRREVADVPILSAIVRW